MLPKKKYEKVPFLHVLLLQNHVPTSLQIDRKPHHTTHVPAV